MKRLIPLLILLLAILPAPVMAQRLGEMPSMPPQPVLDERIAAVVNDNVITTSDIDERIKLAMLSSGLPDSEEIRARLLSQILRSLIDEQLQMQEAKRLDITVTSDEINGALEKVARDNGISDMRLYLAERGISSETMTDQIRATISWTKVVQRTLRPRVEIGDDEVDAVIERMRANAGKEEYLVSEIVLPVDNPSDEEQVKQFAENLVQQLKGGANFGAIARQFSQGTGAASGGDIGWIQEGQLPQELSRTLLEMNANEISPPIRTASGYHILGVREKRTISLSSSGNDDVSLTLQQAFRPLDPGTNSDPIVQEAAEMRSTIVSCNNLEGTLQQNYPTWRLQNLGEVKLSKAPSWLIDKVRDLSAGKASEPIATDKGALVVFVCSRSVTDGNVNREAIYGMIGSEKLELQARRLLRDLRRSAYLDVRLSNPS